MTTFTTIQALVHLDDRPATTPEVVLDALNRVGLGEAQSLTSTYRDAMQPEAIDAEFGVWNVWVPQHVADALLRDGQVWRQGLNADVHAEVL